jgi:DNA-binding NtrC family response regulator
MTLSDAARDVLLGYHWPGNVRELRNVIERATMLAESNSIGADDLGLPVDPSTLRTAAEGAETDAVRLEDVERQHIVRILAKTAGSRTRAATMLGISRSTLWEKGKRYGLF